MTLSRMQHQSSMNCLKGVLLVVCIAVMAPLLADAHGKLAAHTPSLLGFAMLKLTSVVIFDNRVFIYLMFM